MAGGVGAALRPWMKGQRTERWQECGREFELGSRSSKKSRRHRLWDIRVMAQPEPVDEVRSLVVQADSERAYKVILIK